MKQPGSGEFSQRATEIDPLQVDIRDSEEDLEFHFPTKPETQAVNIRNHPTVPSIKRKPIQKPARSIDPRETSFAKEDMMHDPLTIPPSPALAEFFGPPLFEKHERDTAPLKPEEVARLSHQLGNILNAVPRFPSLQLPPPVRIRAESRWLDLQIVVLTALSIGGTGIGLIEKGRHLSDADHHQALATAHAERDQAIAALNDLREQFIRPPVLDTATQEQRDAKVTIEKVADRLFSTIFNEHTTPASIASAIETMASELDNDTAYTRAMPHKESVSQIRVALTRRLFEDRQLTPEEREHRLTMVDAGIRSPHVSNAYVAARKRGPDAITDLFVRTRQEVGIDGPVARATLASLLNGQTELPAITIEKLSHIPHVHRPLVLGLLSQQRTNYSALFALDETLHHSGNSYSKIERDLIIEQRERLEQEGLRITHLIGQLVIQIHLPTEIAL